MTARELSTAGAVDDNGRVRTKTRGVDLFHEEARDLKPVDVGAERDPIRTGV